MKKTKSKKKKLTSLLKIGSILFGMSFLLICCDSEEDLPVIENIKSHLEKAPFSNKKASFSNIGFKVIDWKDMRKKKFIQKFIYDIQPHINISKLKNDEYLTLDLNSILEEKSKNYSKYYFKIKENLKNPLEYKNLIVTIFPNKKYYMRIVTFQQQKDDDYSLIKNKFITLKQLRNSKPFKKTIQSKSSNCFDINAELEMCTMPSTIVIYMCNNGYSDYHLPRMAVDNSWCTGSLPWTIENQEYTQCINNAWEMQQEFINQYDGICDESGDGGEESESPDQIDASGLTGKARCIYGKMVDNKNNINWILENFRDGDKPSEFDLKFEMSTSLGNLTNASTVKSGNTFIIRINQYRSENINTSLTNARTILHEGIHARLREFASREGSNETSFPGVYDYFRNYGKNWDHQQMASHYRNTIAQGLKQFDNGQHSNAYYDALAWEGLSEIKDLNGNQDKIYTEAWKELSPNEQQDILNTISEEKQNGNKTCE